MYDPQQNPNAPKPDYWEVERRLFKLMNKYYLPQMVREIGKRDGFNRWLNHKIASEAEEIAVR